MEAVLSDIKVDIQYAACTQEQEQDIPSSDFCSVISFFIPTSVASAKHAYIGPFSLLVGTYEN